MSDEQIYIPVGRSAVAPEAGCFYRLLAPLPLDAEIDMDALPLWHTPLSEVPEIMERLHPDAAHLASHPAAAGVVRCRASDQIRERRLEAKRILDRIRDSEK